MSAALVAPTVVVRDSFLAAMDEFRAEGRGGPDDHSTIGEDLRAAPWDGEHGFAGYVDHLAADRLADTPRPPDRVAATTLWWVDRDEYLGRVAVRHELTEWLRDYGGHIGSEALACGLAR